MSGIVASAAVANFLVDSRARKARVRPVRGRRWSLPPPRPTREAPSGGAIAPHVVSCNLGTTPAPRSRSAYTAPRAEPRITPRRRTTDRGRTVRVLHIRPALRDRAPSVRGIRHVLSQRASDALAPRTPSADDRAVHGTAGLRVAAGVIPSNSGPCMRRVRKSVSHRRSVRLRCHSAPADWGCSFSPLHAGGEQEPCGGGVGETHAERCFHGGLILLSHNWCRPNG
jgi:hypothetical protein